MSKVTNILSTIGIATVVAGSAFCVNETRKIYSRSIERQQAAEVTAKTYILKNNQNKYIELINKGTRGPVAWTNAAMEVQDSMRVDSLCKKAYFEGAQMVRDSIAKANLNDTVKTVMKSVK